MADTDLDDVPPLEDMSELLHQVETIRDVKSRTSAVAHVDRESKIASQGVEKPTATQKYSAKQNGEISAEKKASKPKESFGGLKKGFLFSSNTSKQKKPSAGENTKTTTDDMPFIKAKKTDSSPHEIPEVQEAMKAGQAFAQNKEWVTDDLLQKISQNPHLMNRLADPSFMQAVAEFQTDPQGAMKKYAGNSEMQDFLQDFCKIMGTHLTNLADKQQASASPPAPTPPPSSSQILTHPPNKAQITPHDPQQEKDEQQVRELLADPEIRDILLDERIQQLVSLLHKDPEQAQRVLQMADEKLRKNVHKLVSAGVLQFQR